MNQYQWLLTSQIEPTRCYLPPDGRTNVSTIVLQKGKKGISRCPLQKKGGRKKEYENKNTGSP